MLVDATAALRDVFSPPFRIVLWKVIGLTAALLVLAMVGLHHGLLSFVHLAYPWLQTFVAFIAGLGLVFASIFLVAPISALVAGFFVDDLAETVERKADPSGPLGQPLPIGRSIFLSVRFALVSLAVTLVALVLLLLPGINAIAFVLANTYILGRQYFEFAALRFRSYEEVRAMRRHHWPSVMLAGFCIALFVSVPLLNLLTPLFGTALMVRVHKRLSGARLMPAQLA